MSNQGRTALLVIGVVMVVMLLMVGFFATMMGGPFGFDMAFPGVFLIVGFIIVVAVIAMAAAARGGPRIQRPSTQQTAYPPPPPPDSVLVKCPYCGTTQPFSHDCVNCGAPLPKPQFN